MLKLFIIVFFTIPYLSISQIKTVYAEGGEIKVDWDLEERKTKQEDTEIPFLYGSGCTESPSYSNTSSNLPNKGLISYSHKNLIDWNPRTAWVEGKADYGIGEYIEVNLIHGNDGIAIFNGYQKSYETWKNNSRVKKFKVYGDNKLICFVVLNDLMGYQVFDLPSYKVHKKYKFEIVEVYPGLKWKDVAISEITSLGCCFNINTKILSSENYVNCLDIKDSITILSIDSSNNQLFKNKVLKTVKSNHKTLLRIETAKNSIEITPYHPLNIKNYGITSLLKLRQLDYFATYEDRINQIEVLIWNNEKKQTEYVKIVAIKILHGDFNTFSIQSLKKSHNYVVNGFVTYTY